MKIFIYSDLHISKTSSILPNTSDNPKYTYRQNMILETGKYLADIIDQVKPDMIINLGDTFDQHTVTSYDIKVASEFFKCFRYLNIPHLVLVGNHEMVNYDFNAIEILSNIDNITVISEPCTIDGNFIKNLYGNTTNVPELNTQLALMPYMEFKDILNFPDGTYLFSHIDIMGIKIRGNFELPEGVSKEQLSKYKLVFNGHIHRPSIKDNVVNVGSISTHSFSDDDECVPQCYLFDTETLDLTTYKPTTCPLFRKFEICEDINELEQYISGLDSNYKYVLQVVCPFELKELVKSRLSQSDKILSSRLNVRVDKTKQAQEKLDVTIQSNIDIVKSFKDFLKITELKYPEKLYLDILEGVDSNVTK